MKASSEKALIKINLFISDAQSLLAQLEAEMDGCPEDHKEALGARVPPEDQQPVLPAFLVVELLGLDQHSPADEVGVLLRRGRPRS